MALDGSMLVHESFDLAAGEHGIERRIPNVHATGERFVVEIMHAERDGAAVGWQEEISADALTVRLPRVAQARRHGLLYHVDGHLALAQGREWLLWRPPGSGPGDSPRAARVGGNLPPRHTHPRDPRAGHRPGPRPRDRGRR
ncbi:MAG: hypothetical protein M5U09_16390 [Gammaproteobacteria bacterium]|nr:hypothetical protein [Gammaproteobacteria bacterium]